MSRSIRPHISVTNAASGKKSNVYIQEQPVSQAPAMFDEIKELRERLAESAKMLRRGQIACERQGWEKGESTEAWYFFPRRSAEECSAGTRQDGRCRADISPKKQGEKAPSEKTR